MTDCEFLLEVLADRRPHSLNEILQRSFAERGCGLTVHSRASELRDRGHVIVHQTVGRRGDGSLYQLVARDEDLPEGPVLVSRSQPPPAVAGSGCSPLEPPADAQDALDTTPAVPLQLDLLGDAVTARPVWA